MIKHYGRENKGFTKANANRTMRAIAKRIAAGQTSRTNKKLAEMMDRVYGTSAVELYHSKRSGGK